MAAPGPTGKGTLKPISPRRSVINKLFQRASTVPQISCTVDVDMSRTTAMRDQSQALFERQTGTKLGFMPFFIQAAARGLRACPEANATLVERGLWLHNRIQMGISIPSPDGVIIPVLRDPDQKSLVQIALEIDDFYRRSPSGAIWPQEYSGATFGLSNSGTLGIKRDIPMVIPPHTACLTCAAIERRPVVVGDRVEVRPIMEATLSFDHRAMDGEGAQRFFTAFRDCLENARFS